MSAIETIRRVEAMGGRLHLSEGQLKVQAATPLPDAVMEAIKADKASIMVALGAPIDAVVGAVLSQIRPHLPPALQRLSDERLLVLVNWSIMNAWNTSVRKVATP